MSVFEYKHREAYCLMRYAGGGVVEWIWNSRDGVTPFGVTSRCGKQMFHVNWYHDVRIKDYQPQVGERIFVDATPELLRPLAENLVRKNYPNVGGQNFENQVGEMISMWLQPGAPFVKEVEVEQTVQESSGKQEKETGNSLQDAIRRASETMQMRTKGQNPCA